MQCPHPRCRATVYESGGYLRCQNGHRVRQTSPGMLILDEIVTDMIIAEEVAVVETIVQDVFSGGDSTSQC